MPNRSVSLFVPGLPIPKGRARTAIRKKKDGEAFVVHTTPEDTVKYEKRVRAAGKRAFSAPLEGPLELRAVFHFPVPQSYSKSARERAYGSYKAIGGDLDNYCKAILDGLNRQPLKYGGKIVAWDYVAWKDDSQVSRLLLAKKYVETDSDNSPVGVSITITELE